MDVLKEISATLTPFLFAGLLFFIHRYIKQGDKLFTDFLPLQMKIAVIHRDLSVLNELKADLKSTMEDIFALGAKVEKVLTVREDLERMSNQIDKLKMRDDLLWDELRKKMPQ